MSHGNGSGIFVIQVMGILKPVTVSTDKGLQLSHSPMVGCNSLYRSNFDFHMTYFASRPRPVNLDHARPWLCPRIGKWTPPPVFARNNFIRGGPYNFFFKYIYIYIFPRGYIYIYIYISERSEPCAYSEGHLFF